MALRDIIGQDRAINILLKTVQRGRLPSSYLFAGESGTGKKLAAINLAKAINCLTASNRNAEDIDACDECPSCRKIDSGIHPDFLLISPEGGLIRIEEIRAIDDLLSLKAFEGIYKVVVVDDADMMNQSAANAFLKTLEEPPENNLIILISSNPDRLPDTIRSRCSRINFTPLALEACEEIIKKVLSRQSEDKVQRGGRREEVKKRRSEKDLKTTELPDSRTLSLLVRLSMGRPGNVIAGDLIEEREWFMKLLKDMLNAEKDGWTSKEEMEKWFDLLLILLRDMAVLKITRNERDLINIDIKERLNKLSSSMDITVIIDNYQQLNTLKGYFNFHLNKSLTWNFTGSLLRKTMGGANA
ncbi:MAG: DNA polymerase III subunit delta' [Thermodesulfovibrionales bacterium]